MTEDARCRVAILYPGNREARQNASPEKNRFLKVFQALAALGVHAEPAVYHDDFCDDVRRQLMQVDGVLVWVNPIEGERDRSALDAMLREVAVSGVFVSAHPDVILKLGTKEVLYRTRDIGWGCVEEKILLSKFLTRCEPYFAGDGRMIDQAYQSRLPEGMIRCYLVHNKVAGLGHQAINALYPTPTGTPPDAAPQPGPRLYHPPSMLEFQSLKRQLEQEWVPATQRLLDIDTNKLPVLWDCDFLLGPKSKSGEDTYVLCEINVSSVSPFPDSAVTLIAQATLARTQAARRESRSVRSASF